MKKLNVIITILSLIFVGLYVAEVENNKSVNRMKYQILQEDFEKCKNNDAFSKQACSDIFNDGINKLIENAFISGIEVIKFMDFVRSLIPEVEFSTNEKNSTEENI